MDIKRYDFYQSVDIEGNIDTWVDEHKEGRYVELSDVEKALKLWEMVKENIICSEKYCFLYGNGGKQSRLCDYFRNEDCYCNLFAVKIKVTFAKTYRCKQCLDMFGEEEGK